jgi:hypothetical protein
MKSAIHAALVAALSTTLAGCQEVHAANMVALGVTVGLFFGTLNLNRRPAAPPATRGDATASVRPSVK